jgi:signal transduction histidine kinase
VLVAGSIAVTAFALTVRGAAHAPTVRATIETGLTICGLISVGFAWSYWKRTYCMAHALIAVAVLAMTLEDFEFLAAPAMLGSQASTLRSPALLMVRLILAVLFTAAALAGRRELAPPRRPALALLAVPALCLVIPTAIGLASNDIDDWFMAGHGRVLSPIAITLTVPAIALLLLVAARFIQLELRQRDDLVKAVLGAGLILLAGTWLYSLLMPGLTTDSVSGHEYLRAGAYGLVLLAAVRMRVLRDRMAQRDAADRERRRLIADLHDGMAQDLAFVVAQSEKLARELGSELPIVLAARRALAFSQEAIVDLAASDAPTVGDALQALADELSGRHAVHVRLRIDGDDLPATERDAVVRIAREAIVNAVRHGKAKTITVSLHVRGRQLMLIVSDDGRGLGEESVERPRSGYGSRVMRRRAEAIGGRLRTRPVPGGGLAVELTVS